jgi:hypothetical protein
MNRTTQLANAETYDIENIIFAKPEKLNIPSADPSAVPMNYNRIKISTRNPDGTIGDLILETPECFSFGISENTDKDSGKITGHSMSFCLWTRDPVTSKASPKPNEKAFTDCLEEIIKKVRENLLDVKDELIPKYASMEDTEFGYKCKFESTPYWKKEEYETTDSKGRPKKNWRRVEGAGPTLYAKLIEYNDKKTKEKIIYTNFYDGDELIKDCSVLNKQMCNAIGVVKIDSIFVGSLAIALQIRLVEAVVKIISPLSSQRFLKTSRPTEEVLAPKPVMFRDNEDEDNESVGRGSLNDEEPVVTPTAKSPKPSGMKRKVKIVPARKE